MYYLYTMSHICFCIESIVTVVYTFFSVHVDDLHQCQINCSIIVVSCQKLSNFSQIYANKFLELLLRAHAWGSKYFGTTLKYLDRESKYFEVVGPHGGPVISEGVMGVQLFQRGSKYFSTTLK